MQKISSVEPKNKKIRILDKLTGLNKNKAILKYQHPQLIKLNPKKIDINIPIKHQNHRSPINPRLKIETSVIKLTRFHT